MIIRLSKKTTKNKAKTSSDKKSIIFRLKYLSEYMNLEYKSSLNGIRVGQ